MYAEDLQTLYDGLTIGINATAPWVLTVGCTRRAVHCHRRNPSSYDDQMMT